MKILESLPSNYRQRSVGEVIECGDYMKIHKTYYEIVDGSDCIGDEIYPHGSPLGGMLLIFTDKARLG